jgi:hypothetical protein
VLRGGLSRCAGINRWLGNRYSLYNGVGGCSNYAGYINFAQDMCFPVSGGRMSLGLRCTEDGSGASFCGPLLPADRRNP